MSRRNFTVTMETPGLLEHIEAKLSPPRPDCLIWPGAVDRGYGRVWVDGKAKRVHRVVWELKHGTIPDGLTIDHLCRIRSCCNTEHMELVTQGENNERAVPFRTPRFDIGSCRKGHPYTDETTKRNPDGSRRCLICRAASDQRYEARRAARTKPHELADTG